VAVFRERAREIDHERELSLSHRSDASPAASPAPGAAQSADRAAESTVVASPAAKAAGALREERLGTGHGEREYAPTTHTSFERASERPAEVVRLRYDSAERLLASGVIRPRRPMPQPEPFPSFVPDPKG
jgi:hypothetical protein